MVIAVASPASIIPRPSSMTATHQARLDTTSICPASAAMLLST
jgi:hypothetical protein